MTLADVRKRLTGWWGETRGVAAIEFACAAPIFTFMLVGLAEIGLAVQTRLAAEEAVAAGAQSAMRGYDAQKVTTAVQSANPNVTIQASPAPAVFYACPTASGLARTLETATCADEEAPRRFVEISATATRPTVFGVTAALPATMTARATVRAQ